jgi:hypothetical protein
LVVKYVQEFQKNLTQARESVVYAFTSTKGVQRNYVFLISLVNLQITTDTPDRITLEPAIPSVALLDHFALHMVASKVVLEDPSVGDKCILKHPTV